MTNKVPLAIADVELQLATAISVGGTSFTLSSATDDDGVALPAGKYCFTLDNGNSNKEYLMGQLNGTAVTTVVSVSRQGVETTGAVRAHRVGTSVILTDFATIQRVADILRGIVTLDGASPVSYDTAPSLSSNTQLATVGYVLSIVSGGTVNFDNQIITSVNAGETVVAGNLLYFKTSDQEWYKCDGDVVATVDDVQLGIALGAGSDGVAITGGVLVAGVYTTTGLTTGSKYYASNTAGAISATPGTVSVHIGWALSTTRLFVNFRAAHVPTAIEKAAISNLDLKLGKISMTAGETINGATTPVPVYQNKTDFEVYACDGNDTARMKFIGFATTSSTDGNSITVQTQGIVPGFTALTRGEKYYVSDTVGTISTTAGTTEILVGLALSTTELLIQKGKRYANGVISLTDAGNAGQNTDTAIVCGFRPSKITAFGSYVDSDPAYSSGSWVNGLYAGVKASTDESGSLTSIGVITTKILEITSASGTSQWSCTIQSVIDTGFTFRGTQDSNAPANFLVYWVAEGEI